MLYELVGIVRPGKIAEVKDIVKTAGLSILQSQGVIRGITNWGTFALPKPTRDTSALANTQSSRPKDKLNTKTASTPTGDASVPTIASQATNVKTAPKYGPKHYAGHYFVLRWDSNSKVQHSIRRTMSLDPRIIRYTIVRMGDKLEETCDVGGKTEEWSSYGAGAVRGVRWSERNGESLAASLGGYPSAGGSGSPILGALQQQQQARSPSGLSESFGGLRGSP